ncbi:MAG: YIP1 family protein [Desulfobacteraceae bacterium]|nr:MAG: YIP1 family protein [Desulfobacteraceae bacterium]
MLINEILLRDKKKWEWAASFKGFIKTSGRLLLHPGQFYEEMSKGKEYMGALPFLLSTCILFTLLAGFMMAQGKALIYLIFFLNAFLMPFIMAFILYLSTLVLCREVFTYQSLFRITAYANVTLLSAWIPGLSWVMGIWKFCLIGLGMVKVGRISGMKAFISLVATACIFVLLIQVLQLLLSNVK